MRADSISLLEFIGTGKRVFYIPVYQRNYDWKKAQCVTLFRDIEKIAVSNERSSHFLGAIVCVENGTFGVLSQFTVIDGQQRLTSIMLLLKALIDSTEDEGLKDEIKEDYLINKRITDESLRIKLKPMKSDASSFQRLMDNKCQDAEESQIFSNYRLFVDLISKSKLTPNEIYGGIQKLEIVYIKVEKENPQMIFESLNSTGLDLTQADLIRNFLLMGQEYHIQKKLYNNYWVELEKMLPDIMISDFIRDYLTLKTRTIPLKDKVYESFKEYYLDVSSRYDVEGFLDELKTYGTYYSWFRFCNCPDDEINNRLSQIQRLKSTTVYPFLLSIFEDCYMYKSIDIAALCSALDVLLSYFIRRLLCEMPTNALNKVFATMASDVRQHKSGTLSSRISAILAKKQGKTRFPDDSLLKDKLLSRNSSKFPHIKFILEQIERRKWKETVEFEALTIEHIMPQNLNPQWNIDLGNRASDIHEKFKDCIGNLTLAGPDYNSGMKNNSFREKREYFLSSNIAMNREIGANENWGENEIIKRAASLINDICSIWPCPEAVKERKNENDLRTEFELKEEVNVKGRTPVCVEICGDKISVESWSGFFRAVCRTMYDYEPQIFRSLLRHKDFAGKGRRIISETEEGISRPYKVAEGIYVETYLTANDAVNYAKLIIEKYDNMDDEVSYRLNAK